MKSWTVVILTGLTLSVLTAGCPAQTLPATLPGIPAPAAPGPIGPVTAAPEVMDLLKMLQDRKLTLKDFTAKIDYNVEDLRGDSTGKRGTLGYLVDPAKGPIFSSDFTINTRDGKATQEYHAQVIFDGKDLTAKDWGLDGKSKTYVRSTVRPPGAKPGDAVNLGGALPLPIGLDVADVLQTFDVKLEPSKEPGSATLKLVPRNESRFNYKQLVVTVDRKMELPTKLVQTARDDTVTTITLTAIEINTGKAKMLDPSTPAADGWSPKVQ